MQEFIVEEALRDDRERRVRQVVADQSTGPLLTRGGKPWVDPLVAVRPGYHGPRHPPRGWQEDEETVLPPLS